jgi:hypothetical protein
VVVEKAPDDQWFLPPHKVSAELPRRGPLFITCG